MVEAGCVFKEASKSWLEWAQTRNRRPIRKSSVPTIESALKNWIHPVIGNLPLKDVHSGSVKHLVTKMRNGGLSPKSITNYVNVVKSVVSSVVDEETGEPVYPRKWNVQVLDLPVIENQRQPCFTRKEVEALVLKRGSVTRDAMLYTLLAATGLRIGEALALDSDSLTNKGMTLVVNKQVDRFGKIVNTTKTRAGMREVDLHPDVAAILAAYMRAHPLTQDGLLFPSREGTPLLADNFRSRKLAKVTDKGFHAFRRFRNTWLRQQNALPDLTIFWMGHSAKGSMTEVYSKVSQDVPLRLKEANRVGVGFTLPGSKG